ncbi:methyltransferase-like protein 25 [Polyodon spathula]|uniref:methyltransferase-like protein 25 n=1 Tax=Polyodon spathula TaxID=7913 RepID=UPI001B7DD2EB|nr:methyltransferase-like protein 25 [Polyodon spathula]
MLSSLIGDSSIETVRNKLDAIKRFLSVSLRISNAHTVDFYTEDVWNEFVAVTPESVLTVITGCNQQTAPLPVEEEESSPCSCGFGDDSLKLVDVASFLKAAKAHSLPHLQVCTSLEDLLQELRGGARESTDKVLGTDDFMNDKKSHEVKVMSEVVASLARYCNIQQVIDLGSGKGYLCSFLSMEYSLKVYGIDSSSTNTHGANERNRKLKRYSKAYQRTREPVIEETVSEIQEDHRSMTPSKKVHELSTLMGKAAVDGPACSLDSSEHTVKVGEENITGAQLETEDLEAGSSPFFGILSSEVVELPTPRKNPAELSSEEKERRKQENLKRKSKTRSDSSLYSPLTSYVTAKTELQEIISDMEDSVMVGLHTCGDLASSTLRIFTAKPELKAVCSVGCCYHLLSEEFDRPRQESPNGTWGFPMSQYMKQQKWNCGRNARMSACLALERVAVGQGLPTESLFYRAVLHVILKEHYGAIKSEKRVGNVYSKTASFVDYIRKALRKLGLDESKLPDSLIQDYYDTYKPRINEMEAFNMLKVVLAPCIEGLILLDRLCYLKEQENTSWSTLVQLFDPLKSPRCYAVVGVKRLLKSVH